MSFSRRAFLTSGLLLLPFTSRAAVEFGRDYDEIAHPVRVPKHEGKVQVTEFFSYGCSHCYEAEATVAKWRQGRADLAFDRVPVIFRPEWETFSRLYAVFNSLGVTEQMHTPFFDALHGTKRVKDGRTLSAWLESQGLTKAKLQPAWNSAKVRADVARYAQLQKQADITSVPCFLVAGRYLVTPAVAGERLLHVVDELVTAERTRANNKHPVAGKRS